MRELPVATLAELLALRARDTPGHSAYHFGDQAVSFAALAERSDAFAAALLRRGLRPDERVLLVLPNSHDFFTAFYGVQRAGGTAVPIFPGAGPARSLSLAQLCGARLIVVPTATPTAQRLAFAELAARQGHVVLAVDDAQPDASRVHFPAADPSHVAYIQYTSGSTGDPKGVQLTSDNLLTNVRQMIAGMEITPRDVFVSWLPVYHDMGLILKTLAPFYLAAPLHLLPTELKNVHAWLDTIQRVRGTFTAAPDYAYRLCLRQSRAPAEYDLRSLRVALNAAEPVRAQTVADFEAAFGLKHVMTAGYGLAEATVGVSMSAPGEALTVDARGLVSVGRPFPQVEVQIVDTEADTTVVAGTPGEIVVRSPANTRGYFGNERATAALFWRDGYIRTGDLGYLDSAGQLFIAGRLKNVIKRAGESVYPLELEECVDTVPGVRYSAAVGVDQGGLEGEQVFILAEVRDGETLPRAALHDLVLEIVNRLHERFGYRPARVLLLRPRGLPLTHNGKLQHAHLREQVRNDSLRASGVILYPDY